MSRDKKNRRIPKLILQNILFRSSPFRVIMIFMELRKIAESAMGIANSFVICLKSGVIIVRSDDEYGNAYGCPSPYVIMSCHNPAEDAISADSKKLPSGDRKDIMLKDKNHAPVAIKLNIP